MALQLTDYLSINRGGTPGTAGGVTGTYLVDQMSALVALIESNIDLISTDANNDLTLGGDGKHYLDVSALETTTTLGYVPGTQILTFTDEDGVATNIDLSALTTDIHVNGASYVAGTGVLTLTDTDGVTPDIVIDLSTLRSIVTNNADGTWSHNDGNGTIVPIVSVSSDALNVLDIGADNGAHLAQEDTALFMHLAVAP